MSAGAPVPSLQSYFPGDQVDEQVRAAREALVKAGSNRSRRVEGLIYLAAALYGRHQYTHQQAEVDEGVELLRQAISLTPARHQLRDKAERVLALLLCVRMTPDAVAESITLTAGLLNRRALESTQDAMLLVQLGMALTAASNHGGSTGLLDDGVALLERAADTTTTAGSAIKRLKADLARFALAIALTARYSVRWSTDPRDAERAGELLEGLDVDRVEQTLPGFEDLLRQMKHGLAAVRAQNGGAPGQPSPDPVVVPRATSGPMSGAMGKSLHTTRSLLDAGIAYGMTSDLASFDAWLADLREELHGLADDSPLRESLLVCLAQVHSLRFRNRQLAGLADARWDLDQALSFAREAVALPVRDVDSMADGVLAVCLLDRYILGLGTKADLEESVELLRHAIARCRADSRSALAVSGTLAEALVARGAANHSLEDINEAEDVLVTFYERLAPQSPVRPIAAVRLAVFLQHRSALTGDTEDVLRASAASRTSMAAAAETSIVWAYDAALHWAHWTWDYGPAAERADAYQQVVRFLYRLARAQSDRGHAEFALRRSSQGVLARAMRALAADGRFTDAVVSAETGRAVLLSAALERDGPALDDAIPAELRQRFSDAGERLRAAESAAAQVAANQLTSDQFPTDTARRRP
ncbi:hypothetical protein ALI22I_28690 [Saccharothrix sp. ALI-22-I]|uniref:hypothetical protein n=1 Tax=Saccharothrix sp. ALI-22-I TaxID=1933778 RepID=UPI00097C4A24|nr:hypothetical protein [Saccharothrix sp. ALI-22-I]ONI84534.1 hypothetical protein ALI22I_28690 [Saccharothrix sp. ALI-22-I]